MDLKKNRGGIFETQFWRWKRMRAVINGDFLQGGPFR